MLDIGHTYIYLYICHTVLSYPILIYTSVPYICLYTHHIHLTHAPTLIHYLYTTSTSTAPTFEEVAEHFKKAGDATVALAKMDGTVNEIDHEVSNICCYLCI